MHLETNDKKAVIKILQINTRDLKIVQQRPVSIRIKIDVYDEKSNTHLEQLECGIINASFSISAESDIRRTASLTVTPVKNRWLRFHKDSIIWMNRILKLQIGIYDNHYREWRWYQQGIYVFTDYGAAYDAETNTLTLSLSDPWANLDGSRSGQIGGAESIHFPAYEEDSDTGEIIKCHTIRDAIHSTLVQLGNLNESQIQLDEIGECKGMEQYNPDYLGYREESKILLKDGSCTPTWNVIPYDQTFSVGSTVASILTTFRDLYPNYEMYFDESGNFVCQMIPSCHEDDIVFDSAFFDRIYLSENTSVDMAAVRNVCEVWGKSIETDFYTEDCTYSGGCYSCHVESYPASYRGGDCVAVKIPTTNQKADSLNINGIGMIPIFDENTEKPIDAKLMEPNQIYVFEIKKKWVENQTVTISYLLGQWQPHAVDVLTNGTNSDGDDATEDGTTKSGITKGDTTEDDAVVKKYSKEYFQKRYHCKTVHFTIVKDSPFCIEELGILSDVKTGGEYENITSDSLASARAAYENWKNSRLTDSINITTKLCPFADVNRKVSYRRKDTGEINPYIVKNISHDPANGTTSWTLMRFYPLAKEDRSSKQNR